MRLTGLDTVTPHPLQVVGAYRCLPSKQQNYTAGTFRTLVIANNVIVLSKEVAPSFSARDVAKIKRFCRNPKYVSIIIIMQLVIYLFVLGCV